MSGMMRYGAAVAGTGLALLVVSSLHPVLDAGSYMVFLAAVVVVAAALGFRPALVTTVGAILAIDFYFLAPRGSLALFAVTDAVLLVVFGGTALLTSVLMARLHERRDRAERRALESAGIASLLERDATELGRDVDALVALRQAAREPRRGAD